MPIYEYQCNQCEYNEDLLCTHVSPKRIECPQCKRRTFSRQVVASNIPPEVKGGTPKYHKDKS